MHARTPTRLRSRPLLVGGITALGLGVVLVAAGAGYAATPARCGATELCGLGQGLETATIMGFGGGFGLVGIVLTAIGGSSISVAR